MLTGAVEQLIQTTYDGFASWLAERAGTEIDPERAAAISAVGLGDLFSSRPLGDSLGVPLPVSDENLVRTWVEMMRASIQTTASRSARGAVPTT